MIFPCLSVRAPSYWNFRERRCRGGNQDSEKFINVAEVTPHHFHFQTSSQALLQGISGKAAGSRCPTGTRSWLSILPPGGSGLCSWWAEMAQFNPTGLPSSLQGLGAQGQNTGELGEPDKDKELIKTESKIRPPALPPCAADTQGPALLAHATQVASKQD